MQFSDFHREILSRANVVGAAHGSPAINNPKHADAVCAAAAKVIADRGPEWCVNHPRAFQKEIWGQLSFWWKATIFVAGFFVPGGSIWLTIIGQLVPVIFKWLTEQQTAGLVGAGPMVDLGNQAEEFVKGLSQ